MKPSAPLNEKCFFEFLKLIHMLTGITVGSNRISMVEGRLRKRIIALGLPDFDVYLELVKNNKVEQTHFIDLITTNETYFFRTPRIWDYIENKFLPAWHERNPDKVFMVWSAAASSGEEAHTLGIICQAFKEKSTSFHYKILGTDISQEMIGLCQQGVYSGKSVELFKNSRPELFSRYMKTMTNDSVQVVTEIRSHLRFQTHNLFHSLQSKDRFDLILLRNVLIYFQGADQETVLAKIAPKLEKDGVLVIGESESLNHVATPYKYVEPLVYCLNLDHSKDLKVA